jgi:hypothetical protein
MNVLPKVTTFSRPDEDYQSDDGAEELWKPEYTSHSLYSEIPLISCSDGQEPPLLLQCFQDYCKDVSTIRLTDEY